MKCAQMFKRFLNSYMTWANCDECWVNGPQSEFQLNGAHWSNEPKRHLYKWMGSNLKGDWQGKRPGGCGGQMISGWKGHLSVEQQWKRPHLAYCVCNSGASSSPRGDPCLSLERMPCRRSCSPHDNSRAGSPSPWGKAPKSLFRRGDMIEVYQMIGRNFSLS